MKLKVLPMAVIGGLILAACGTSNAPTSSSSATGGSVSLWAEWSSNEQNAFQGALQPFNTQSGTTVNYASKGSNIDTVLEAAVSGGAPPDVALIPDPGTLQTLAKQGSIKDLTGVLGGLTSNYGSAWNTLASYNGKVYGVWFKGANKNTIWYNPAEFAAAGISSPPTTWEQLIQDAGTLKAAGVTPFSLCTDVGWPVADFWQNVYLKTAGADKYNALSAHSVKWTDSTVTTAFTTLAQLVGTPSNLAGGVQGSLSNAYPACADKVFPKAGSQPQAAMVFEGDFVSLEITGNSKNYNPGTTGSGGASCTTDPSKTPCYNFFDFPAPSANSANSAAIQGAGDVAVMLKDTPQSEALIKFLAGPDGAAIWAHLGGFASPNKKVPASAYPDPVSKGIAQALVGASSFVFSLDDLQGTWEKNMWQDLLDFVKNPSSSNISSIQATMDQQATAGLGH
ncbi:MAG TPA: extracellular solute-binding protein [Candidatus Dormibacteraeota bacterium]|jgi:ABC-type glycerol-3-phosphate transport system substrate-binding protein|nr:extracellular solute-binding protein [Candidatus Dormibacteraeota bacterium]